MFYEHLGGVVFRESLRFLLFFHFFINSWYSDHSKRQNYIIEYLEKTNYIKVHFLQSIDTTKLITIMII